MASISRGSPPLLHLRRNPLSFHSSPSTLRFPFCTTPRTRAGALKTASGRSRDAYGRDLLRKPAVSQPDDEDEDEDEDEDNEVEGSKGEGEGEYEKKDGVESQWVDWEDQILEDTVPLVGVVRMILHSQRYKSGERLSPEHEKIIVERLLPYHPGYEGKIGCGIDYITVGFHPEFESSRCLFIVRKDGELVDFSYWKCIKGLIRKNYPLYADSFILRHFRHHRRNV